MVKHNKNIRIGILRPPMPRVHKFSRGVESLALGYLASEVRGRGHEAIMLDAMLCEWNYEQATKKIIDAEVDALAVTSVHNHFPEGLRQFFTILRSNGFDRLIIFGGHAASFFPERILEYVPEIDAVAIGNGESIVGDLVDKLADGSDGNWQNVSGLVYRSSDGGIRRIAPKPLLDIDALHNPARDLTKEVMLKDGQVALSSSRGCFARCTFCSIPRFQGLHKGGKYSSGPWLGRDPAAVAIEMLSLNTDYGVREVLIVDDEFFGSNEIGKKRAWELAKILIENRSPINFAFSCRAENVDRSLFYQLQEAGLKHVYVGVESGNDSTLKLFGKQQTTSMSRQAIDIIKSLGLSFQAGFMNFNHATTLSDLEMNLEFLKSIDECKPALLSSSVDPHFGSPLTELMKRDGVVVDHGLRLSSTYLHRDTAIMKQVADICHEYFEKHMNFIAAISASVSYEWRRQVPQRTQATSDVIRKFEIQANSEYSGLFERALAELQKSKAQPLKHEFEKDLLKEIANIDGRLEQKKAFLMLYLKQAEGDVRYWSQLDVIHGHADATQNI